MIEMLTYKHHGYNYLSRFIVALSPVTKINKEIKEMHHSNDN